MASVEVTVCGVDDLKNGEMQEVAVGDGKALLVKEDGRFYAVGAKCTHYGAPLAKGAYCRGRVRCPWHGACFNVKTGDIEDYPGLDSLPTFEVTVKDGKVVVQANMADVKSSKLTSPMTKAVKPGGKTFVLVGGGPASVTCAQTLRQEGFDGKIILISKEKKLPYDRPKLSKAMNIKAEDIALRKTDFYENNGIELQLGKEVKSVECSKSTLTFLDGGSLAYNQLLVATGGRPRVLPIPGVELSGVWQLRTPEDANAIAAGAAGQKVVIVGSSFIGLEVASYLVGVAASVTVIGPGRGSTPLGRVFGSAVSKVIRQLHESKGVKFCLEAGVKELTGANGRLTSVVLSDGTSLPADLCVLGVGVVPATEFLKDSGIKITDRGFIPVDKVMQTSQEGVFAAGDIVEFPLFTQKDAAVNVQHWQMAHQHGRVAALAMLGRPVQIHSVPYFWTAMFGKSIRYTGYGPGYDDVVIHGDLEAQKFVAFYTRGDEVVAVASLAYDPVVSQAAELMNLGQVISKAEVLKDPLSWVERLKA